MSEIFATNRHLWADWAENLIRSPRFLVYHLAKFQVLGLRFGLHVAFYGRSVIIIIQILTIIIGILHYVQEPLIIAYSLPIKGNTLIFINSYVRTAVIKLRWALFVTYTIIQSITSSKMCSLHLTHPSAHTLGAVGSRRCGARGAVGGSVPCSNVLPQSWTIPAGARFEPTTSGYKSNTLSTRPTTVPRVKL